MRIDVSEAVLCGCDTCVQHRTLCTQEAEPTNVIDSSDTSIQPLGSPSDQTCSPISSGTEATLAPPEPAKSHADASLTSSPVQTSKPTIFSFPPAVTPVSSEPAQSLGPTGSLPGPTSSFSSRQADITNIFGSGASAASVPSMFGTMQAPTFGSGSSSSISSPFDASTPSSFLPAQDSGKTASDFPPPFSYPGGFARPDVGVSPSGHFGQNNFSGPTPKNPFGSFLHPGFGVRHPPNPFGPNPQNTTPMSGCSSFFTGVGAEQGSRYPRYAPTPDLDYSGGQGKLIISISASNSHGHKSHEELRWEDYQKGDKGGFGWFPPAHTVSPSLFAAPNRPQMRTTRWSPTQENMTGFPYGYTFPTALQRPHEPAGVSSPASGCTACGATSSSSPSGHLGFNGTTNPPSSATTLPGLFFSTYGSFPLLFGPPNLAAYGTTTTPAVLPYALVFGTNFTSQGTTASPAVQAYPMMFGTQNLAAQGTTTAPPVQPYPTMFGTPNLASQGTATTPAGQPYPIMFGTPNIVTQGTTTAPAVQPYPMVFGTLNLAAPAVQPYPTMFGTPNLADQGTTTAPPVQPYPTMFETPNLAGQSTTTTPAVQPYPMMFGTPNLAGQGTKTTPEVQAYPMMFGAQNLAAQSTTAAPSVQLYPMMFGTPNLAGQGTTTTPTVQPYPMMFGTPNIGAQGITPASQAYPAHGLTFPFAAMSLQ